MIMLQIDIIIATNIADQNEENLKYSDPINAEVNSSIAPLITMLKRPRVSRLTGNVKITRIGLTATLRIARTNAASKATQA